MRLSDEQAMTLALAQAEQAAAHGEVPVGAVLLRDGELIAAAGNAPISQNDPCAHAEILALRAAAHSLGNYRLDGCELFVTLEPCAMCSGAALQARLKRVVFGATEPKTGAAGSVLNLFDNPRINHHTAVQGGVLAERCSAQLADFFQRRRAARRQEISMNLEPLRDDALRTPESCFEGLPDYPWQAHYLNDLPSLDGLRLHYLDEQGSAAPPLTWLCLHGNPAWSYLFRKMIPVFLAAGHRVVAPDMIGFGKSDKPKKDAAHHFDWHRQMLLEFVERLDLRHVVLVVQDWGGLLGLTLPMEAPERYQGLLVMNTTLATGELPLSPGFLAWREMNAKNPDFDVARLFARGNPQMSAAECVAYMAPFPDRGHRAALRAFPPMVPEHPDSEGAATSRRAQAFWREQWSGKTLMAVGEQDPVLGLPAMRQLQTVIRNCPEPWVLPQAGHFVQEHGREIAERALTVFTTGAGQ